MIGIRPGEKLHEIMVPAEEARLTTEFDDFFVIRGEQVPQWPDTDFGFYEGNRGSPVADDFRYASDQNTDWLSVEQLREMVEQ